MNNNLRKILIVSLIFLFTPCILFAGDIRDGISNLPMYRSDNIDLFANKLNDFDAPSSSLLIVKDDFFLNEINQDQKYCKEMLKVINEKNTPISLPLEKFKDEYDKKLTNFEEEEEAKNGFMENEGEFVENNNDINDDHEEKTGRANIIILLHVKGKIFDDTEGKNVETPFGTNQAMFKRSKGDKSEDNDSDQKDKDSKDKHDNEDENSSNQSNSNRLDVCTIFEEEGLWIRKIKSGKEEDEIIKLKKREEKDEEDLVNFQTLNLSDLSAATFIKKGIHVPLFSFGVYKGIGVIFKCPRLIAFWFSGLKGGPVTHPKMSGRCMLIGGKDVKVSEAQFKYDKKHTLTCCTTKEISKFYTISCHELEDHNLEYNEGLLCYTTEDIVGLYVGNTKKYRGSYFDKRKFSENCSLAYKLRQILKKGVDFYSYNDKTGLVKITDDVMQAIKEKK